MKKLILATVAILTLPSCNLVIRPDGGKEFSFDEKSLFELSTQVLSAKAGRNVTP
jgi:hypothetical protein